MYQYYFVDYFLNKGLLLNSANISEIQCPACNHWKYCKFVMTNFWEICIENGVNIGLRINGLMANIFIFGLRNCIC